MNDTSREPLNGTSTLLAVHQNPTEFAPDGVGLGAGDQLLVTADSIHMVDLRVVRVLVRICLSRCLTCASVHQRTTWTMEIIRSTCMDTAPGCTCTIVAGH